MAEKERKLFGTDGIRGVANLHPMTPELVLRMGKAIASLFRNAKRRHRILIGRDTRLSGPMIEDALVAGICSMGVDALTVGVLPTPAAAFLTMDMKADAAIMISASHNPFEDNGIKIFQGNGLKLPDAAEARIEALIESERLGDSAPSGAGIGRSKAIFGADGRYAVFLKNAFPKALNEIKRRSSTGSGRQTQQQAASLKDKKRRESIPPFFPFQSFVPRCPKGQMPLQELSNQMSTTHCACYSRTKTSERFLDCQPKSVFRSRHACPITHPSAVVRLREAGATRTRA